LQDSNNFETVFKPVTVKTTAVYGVVTIFIGKTVYKAVTTVIEFFTNVYRKITIFSVCAKE